MKCIKFILVITLFFSFAHLVYTQNIPPYAQITEFWSEDNVLLAGERGLELHLKLNIYNHGSFEAHALFLFFLEDGSMLKDYNGEYVTGDGQVAIEQIFVPISAEENYEVVVFMPYDEMHVKGAKGNLKCLGLIYGYNSEQLAISDYITFFVDGSK